jgi:hypothetical protein
VVPGTSAKLGSLHSDGVRGYLVLLTVAVVPFTQAIGTGGLLHFHAMDGWACWVAVLIAVVTGAERAGALARATGYGLIALSVLVGTVVGTTATWIHPYDTSGFRESTVRAAGLDPIDSLYLPPATHRQFAALREWLRPFIEPEGRAMLAYDDKEGVVLALHGRPVGEAWVTVRAQRRTLLAVVATCRQTPWFADRPPILLFWRAVTRNEDRALAACGLEIARDYEKLTTPPDVASIPELSWMTVYVPKPGVRATGREERS